MNKVRRIIAKSSYLLIALGLLACSSGVKDAQTPVSENQNSQGQAMSINDLPIPSVGEAKLFQHPMPVKLTMDNGIEVWYIHNPLVGLMSMRVSFPTGASYDPAKKVGLLNFTAAMLKEGAAGKSAQTLSDEIENLGAKLTTAVSQDTAAIDLQSLTQFFEKGVGTLADIWLRPDFPVDAFERLQRIWSNLLVQRNESPEAVAKIAGNMDFFGSENPYSMPADGLLSTLSQIKLDDIKQAYSDVFGTQKPVITVVGNIEPQALLSILNKELGKKTFEALSVKAAEFKSSYHRNYSLTIVDKTAAAQSVIRIALPSPKIGDPLNLPLKLVNIPFGGSFTGRLMQNIREDKGYSYGAYSAAASLKNDGIFIAQSSVASEVTGDALREFIKEFKSLASGNFTQEELDRAKATWRSDLVVSFETQDSILSLFSALQVNGQSEETMNQFSKEVEALSLEQFNAWAREGFDFSKASITIVGDKTTILEQIEGLDLPAPVFRSSEGELK